MIHLSFDRGTLLARLDDERQAAAIEPHGFRFDSRVGAWRAPACRYRALILGLRRGGIEIEDEARAYEKFDLPSRLLREPFPHQREALDAWWAARGCGQVVLPTGSGKTFVAQLAMQKARCSTLVVTPTIDLMQQWYGILDTSYDLEIGLLGGGYHEPRALTVTTYDSAYLHMERLGNRYGLLVFDECHHLPGPSYAFASG